MKISFASKKSAPLVRLSPGKETYVERQGGRSILRIGIGEPKKITRRSLILLPRRAAEAAREHSWRTVEFSFDDFKFPGADLPEEDLAEIIAENLELGAFEFTAYKSSRENRGLAEAIFPGAGRLADAFGRGRIVGEETNCCRILSNTPGGEMTPDLLAKAAVRAAKAAGISARVLGQKEIAKLKMGGILGVSKGSAEEPKFIILEYRRGGAEKPVVLVGKGVTFDTGGLNLKPEQGIYEMHMDMSGGAAVIHAMVAAARLKLKRNIVGLVPAVENMPSGSSYRPGDILRSYSGQTIEVLNTDAEGRIILADALGYAEKFSPRLVIDLATLTGAAAVALGTRASALFTRDPALEESFRNFGEKSGDYVWPLPLWEEYENEIKGTFGDWANIGKVRWGGAIHGAVFLRQFAGNYPWVHVDIAPRMTPAEGEHLAKGAAGAGVRLLVRALRDLP